MSYSGGNVAYWLSHPLQPDDVRVLRRIRGGHQSFFANRLSVAYLISMECVAANLDARTLSVTDKGADAIDFYEERA